jgi:hypothetical protein
LKILHISKDALKMEKSAKDDKIIVRVQFENRSFSLFLARFEWKALQSFLFFGHFAH